MDQTNNKDLPWQITAKKLIKFASEFRQTSYFQNNEDEFRRQVGYLLLDVGVETLLRSYLTMPNTKTKLMFTKRDEAAKGTLEKDNITGKKITLSSFDELSFHNLVLAVKQVAEDTVEAGDLEKVEYFHAIRNKIYHLGDGIVPTKENFEEYLVLAQSLLTTLLGVTKTKKEIIFTNSRYDFGDDTTGPEPYKKEYYKELEHKIAIATEIFGPEYATRIFETKLKYILWLYDEENQRESQEKMKAAFNKLTGKEIGDDDFIEKCVNDVTFLRLNLLRKKIDIEQKDIEKYLEYKKWTSAPIKPIEEFTSEDVQRVENLDMWALELERKIDSLVEAYISQ